MNRKNYETNLSNAEWQFLESYYIVPYANKDSKSPKYSKRELINAVLEILGAGYQWRCMPDDFTN